MRCGLLAPLRGHRGSVDAVDASLVGINTSIDIGCALELLLGILDPVLAEVLSLVVAGYLYWQVVSDQPSLWRVRREFLGIQRMSRFQRRSGRHRIAFWPPPGPPRLVSRSPLRLSPEEQRRAPCRHRQKCTSNDYVSSTLSMLRTMS